MNYQELMEQQIENRKVTSQHENPSLLLHACCAPCSSFVLKTLVSFFKISILYYNPNIHPEYEYRRRFDELEHFLTMIDKRKDIKLIEDIYNTEDFYKYTGVRESIELRSEPEKGERCRRCYELRMKHAYEFALKHHYEYMTTTLSISPHKDAVKINKIGETLEKEAKAENEKAPIYLYADFKKKGGFLESTKLAKEYGLYRQDYCGCIYSVRN